MKDVICEALRLLKSFIVHASYIILVLLVVMGLFGFIVTGNIMVLLFG